MQSLRNNWKLWLLFTICWIVIGLTYTINYSHYDYRYEDIFKSPGWYFGDMFIWEMPYWILWALLSPLVFWLTRRFRLERGRLLRNLFIHVSTCLAISLAHRAVYILIGWALKVSVYREAGSLYAAYDQNFFFNLPNGFLCYATILLAVTYYRYHQEEELKISRLEAERAKAQLEALKHTLQPHSLLNTLNSISSVMDNSVEKAEEMLALLGDYLRMILYDSGAQEVTLQEEMEILRCYLAIDRVQFSDRLTIEEEISPETYEAIVPILILQPIVENALHHGIMAHMEDGRIEIRSRRENDWLRLEVRDNGPGLRAANNTDQKHERGVGLANTRKRLECLYGVQHRFHFCDAPEGGLQVILKIPYHTTNVVTTG